MSHNLRIHLSNIKKSLDDVQKSFPKINKKLKIKRDEFTDFVKNNMLKGYEYLDFLLAKDLQVLKKSGMQHMLEMNHIVLCGTDKHLRSEYYQHITATRRKFNENIVYIMKWCKKHNKDSTKKIAAEIYVAILSQPQLFIEGNHRTGTLITNWMLMKNGFPPFVLNTDNAIAYFEPSSEIKMTSKTNKFSLPKYNKTYRKFLEHYLDKKYVK